MNIGTFTVPLNIYVAALRRCCSDARAREIFREFPSLRSHEDLRLYVRLFPLKVLTDSMIVFSYRLDEIMFLLKCDEDESYCMVNDEDVIFNDETVKKGETVRFYYNKKQYFGDVIMFSDDQDVIEKELKRSRTEYKIKRSSNKSKYAHEEFDIKKPGDNKLVGKKKMKTEEKNRRTIYTLVNIYLLIISYLLLIFKGQRIYFKNLTAFP
ncbi:uncharacterized protein LOC114254046 [Monomorium pharaonis]|uniref:uncharacterized protein LOC114254046 n=1 Tax=Monomorium pharaonis TaxID=307658 RepID=UPI00102E10E8|nr:uncharacterized protein LOC114254046 [Monomorium pharaonis]